MLLSNVTYRDASPVIANTGSPLYGYIILYMSSLAAGKSESFYPPFFFYRQRLCAQRYCSG